MARTKKIIGATGVFVLATAGVAAATWSATGDGSGRAASALAQTVTVTAVSGTADLFPGATSGDLHFSATNPNPYPVTFTSFAVGGVSSSDGTACPNSNVTVNASGAISIVVPANANGVAVSIADVVSMAGVAPDGCQNKTFEITVTLTGTQS